MNKDNNNRRQSGIRHAIRRWFARTFRNADTKIMTYVMFIITMVAVFSVTIAWFTMGTSAKIKDFSFSAETLQKIKVTKENDVDGDDISYARNQSAEYYFDVTIPEFSDVPADEIAPGVYGTMKFYVTSLDENVTSCKIVPSIIANYIENVQSDAKDEIEKLLKGHILLFENRDKDAVTGKYIYSNWIDDNGVQVEISCDVPTEVILYWYWPYEYTDVEELKEQTKDDENPLNLDDELVFEWNKSDDEYTELERYDYADTLIGANTESIKFHMSIQEVNS